MLIIIPGIVCGFFLAYANGANDNFKGVATLFGSGATNYKQAILWATLTTALGSITALFVANGLLEAFKGKGLVPAEIAGLNAFGLSVAFAAATTVLLATRLGFPISTTHALIGGLVGAGLAASSSGVYFDQLASNFLVPLIVSPVIAIAATMAIYPILRAGRRRFGIKKETCICVGNEILTTAPESTDTATLMETAQQQHPAIVVADDAVCRNRYAGSVVGIRAESLAHGVHFFSAGAVSFARGLNDTPKIAALLLLGGVLHPTFAIAAVAVLIAAGGLFNASRVAETMSHKVTAMNTGQGLTANLVTSLLVIVASRFGMPVSTTHVSCGSLFGIGATTGQAHWKTIRHILAAWIITLPVAAILGAGMFLLASTF
jgi:PiT family inorganic phosphate transporter